MSDNLFSPTVTSHCWLYPRCQHTVTDRPDAAHDQMEQHYQLAHREDIDAALRRLHPRRYMRSES